MEQGSYWSWCFRQRYAKPLRQHCLFDTFAVLLGFYQLKESTWWSMFGYLFRAIMRFDLSLICQYSRAFVKPASKDEKTEEETATQGTSLTVCAQRQHRLPPKLRHPNCHNVLPPPPTPKNPPTASLCSAALVVSSAIVDHGAAREP